MKIVIVFIMMLLLYSCGEEENGEIPERVEFDSRYVITRFIQYEGYCVYRVDILRSPYLRRVYIEGKVKRCENVIIRNLGS